MKDIFDYSKADSQATNVVPQTPGKFDFDAYIAYEQALAGRCSEFWQNDKGGVLVYRRMRVKEVFAQDACDIEKSLNWQLGALEKSMLFKADIPNFLEPWYGIGTIASAFGFDYVWKPGQAPAVDGKVGSMKELAEKEVMPVMDTHIGKHTLEMIRYFLDKTKGLLPISYCDIQSPLNIASNIVDSNQFYVDFFLDPDNTLKVFDTIADLLIDFTRIQQQLIGDCLAKPGHGFASSRMFDGLGMSDDSMIMLPNDLYNDMAVPSFVKSGKPFGGSVFHSCGNWSGKQEDIVKIEGIKMADGAFSKGTDPDANPTDGFADTFANTGVVLNARIVGEPEVVVDKVKELWKPGMKLIVVTYCDTPKEQEVIYNKIHEICRD